MKVMTDGVLRDETPEEIAEREAWEQAHPIGTTLEERTAALEAAMLDAMMKGAM